MEYQKKQNMILLALALSAFAIGSTEFISVGLMPLLMKDFNISVELAGLTVSLYALGITIGAPILAVITNHWSKKRLLILIMIVFIIGNITVATAPNFTVVLIGRVISSLSHGLFMSIASIIAADVVEPSRRSSAIAVMFTGLTVATVTGVPLGTFIGQISTWHMSFYFISLIGIIGLIVNWIIIPNDLPLGSKTSFMGIINVLKSKTLRVALIITALGYGSTFTVYTFITPILQSMMHWSANSIVIILVIYGFMVAVGNTIGGRLTNQNILPALIKMFIGLLITLILLLLFMSNHWLGLLSVMLLGLFAFMNVPGLQLYIVQMAEKYTPNDISIASALNISAFNIGITLGSLLGGQGVVAVGLRITPYFGIIMVFISILLTLMLNNKNNIKK
ncbi:MFS transporter [Weissella koreensis]|uniref:MFS transporter n=1 Tax=Weissella koreensis TaxID=165096 RepID=UPI0022BA656B|nr:MFS transporter [Weissella koreensis]MCZ9311076.1 MFS transporter [Weissella koreensis]